ncbi:unnamed protein product [Linum tenue]|uniref:Maturase K n=1 Tax=Linum tenue TaxID=586396 RepID=A0AAV0L3P3_9ROSI|nr:unnamed protein product [Linum tenue]
MKLKDREIRQFQSTHYVPYPSSLFFPHSTFSLLLRRIRQSRIQKQPLYLEDYCYQIIFSFRMLHFLGGRFERVFSLVKICRHHLMPYITATPLIYGWFGGQYSSLTLFSTVQSQPHQPQGIFASGKASTSKERSESIDALLHLFWHLRR